jgi:hypothetical protein
MFPLRINTAPEVNFAPDEYFAAMRESVTFPFYLWLVGIPIPLIILILLLR